MRYICTVIIATILTLVYPSMVYTPGHKYKPIVRPAVTSQVSRGSQGKSYIGTFEATSYNLTQNLTKSGHKTKVGIVAVDPEVIPLGTKLYIEGYGPALASDTGRLIKGNVIDVWLPGDDAWEWGRKRVHVWKVE